MGSKIVILGDFQGLFGMQGEGGWSITYHEKRGDVFFGWSRDSNKNES